MTLDELHKKVAKLVREGHGSKQVFGCHSASGSADEVNSVYTSDYVGDCGPFNLKPGEEYVAISVGD